MSSPNKRRVRGLGGVVGGLDSVTAPTSVRGNWPLWLPGASRGFQGSPRGLMWPPVDGGTDEIYSSKVSNTTLGPKI